MSRHCELKRRVAIWLCLKGETVTAYWTRRICAEAIQNELTELAANFEGAGPEAPWTGQEIADHIRERIKNHPILNAIFQ